MSIHRPWFVMTCLAWFLTLSVAGSNTAGSPVLPKPAVPSSPEQLGMPEQLVVGGQVVGRRVDSREGEICLVCGKAISSRDATYLVDGQRVPLHLTPCFEIFGVNPAKYLIKLRPRGAFLDASAAGLELSAIWLYFGSYVLLGLIFGALAAHRAFHVGRSPMRWLGIGLVANLPGFLVLSALPRLEADTAAGVPAGLTKIAATYSPIACPACGAENHPSARECSACGNQLAPRVVSEVQRAGLRNG